MFSFGENVTLHTQVAAGRDSDGNATVTFTDRVVTGCAFSPGGSTELVQGQDMLVTQPTVYLPAGVVVAAVDQITVRGTRFEVDGSPNDWRSPLTGNRPGVEVKLKAVAG